MTYLEHKKRAIMGVINNSRLPEGYTEVNYIEATGNQYILLGAKSIYSPITELEYSSQNLDSSASNRPFFSSGSVARKSNFTIWENAGDSYYIASTLGQQTNIASVSLSQVHKIRMQRESSTSASFYIDDILSATINGSFTGENVNCYFAGTENTSVARYIGRIWYICLWQDGSLIMNLVPCLNPNNVAGFYDLAGGQFYGSSTSAPFLYG